MKKPNLSTSEVGTSYLFSYSRTKKNKILSRIRWLTNWKRGTKIGARSWSRLIQFLTSSIYTKNLRSNFKRKSKRSSQLKSRVSGWLLQNKTNDKCTLIMSVLNARLWTIADGEKHCIHHLRTKFQQQKKQKNGWNTIRWYRKRKDLPKKKKGKKKSKEYRNRKTLQSLWARSCVKSKSRCPIWRLKRLKNWINTNKQSSIFKSWHKDSFRRCTQECCRGRSFLR